VRWKALSIVYPGGSRIATGQKTVRGLQFSVLIDKL
jgi:hypothetical protein